LNLQLLPVQSLPMTTKVVSLYPAHGKGILDTALCDKVCQSLAAGWWGFFQVLQFPSPIKLTATL